jgi:hypothetical protein
MNSRTVVCTVVAVCIGITVLSPPHGSSAEPILKPRKYHGPIPKKYFTLGIGFMGGADNAEMWDLLDRLVLSTVEGQTKTDDFGASFAVDGSYTAKVHPQFAFRAAAGLVILQSESSGKWKRPTDETILDFKRNFDVWLISLDGSAIYYFQDASVQAFQTYAGAGLGVYFPHSGFTEKLTDTFTGEALPENKQTDWDFQPGAHAILGFLYHLNTTTALGMEGRVQMAMSKFTLDYFDTVGHARSASFDVDYTGFTLKVTASKFF